MGSKLGFFAKKQAVHKANLKAYIIQMMNNIKHNNLKRILLAYFQRELDALRQKYIINEGIKQKNLIKKIKIAMRRRRFKKRLARNRLAEKDKLSSNTSIENKESAYSPFSLKPQFNFSMKKKEKVDE